MTKLLPHCLPAALGLFAVLGAAALADVLPRSYDILNRKSIFARDRVSRSPSERGWGQSRFTAATPSTPVLVGLLLEDVGFVAVLELPDSGKLIPLHIGDALPGSAGTVSDITLDYLEFVPAPGRPPVRILVGRNLQGADAPIAVAAATTQPVGASDATALPPAGAGGDATTQPAAGDGDDLLTRMRRRRQQEMNR
jgi:hypothetical protein